MGLFKDFLDIMKVKKEKKEDTSNGGPIYIPGLSPDELVEKMNQRIHDEIKSVLSDKVPVEDMENVIEQVMNGGAYLPADYFNLVPLEEWDNLSGEELENVASIWDDISDNITDKFYCVPSIVIRENPVTTCGVYIELRYTGGYLQVSFEKLGKMYEKLGQKILGMKIEYEDKDSYLDEIKAYVSDLLNQHDLGVKLTEIVVGIHDWNE